MKPPVAASGATGGRPARGRGRQVLQQVGGGGRVISADPPARAGPAGAVLPHDPAQGARTTTAGSTSRSAHSVTATVRRAPGQAQAGRVVGLDRVGPEQFHAHRRSHGHAVEGQRGGRGVGEGLVSAPSTTGSPPSVRRPAQGAGRSTRSSRCRPPRRCPRPGRPRPRPSARGLRDRVRSRLWNPPGRRPVPRSLQQPVEARERGRGRLSSSTCEPAAAAAASAPRGCGSGCRRS
jgi:hypothetical protein